MSCSSTAGKKKRALAGVAAFLLACVVMPEQAVAEEDGSYTGQVEHLVRTCNSLDTVWTLIFGGENVCTGEAEDLPLTLAGMTAARALSDADYAVSLVTNEPTALIAAATGEVAASLNEVTGQIASFDTSTSEAGFQYDVRASGQTVNALNVNTEDPVGPSVNAIGPAPIFTGQAQYESSSSSLNGFRFVDNVPIKLHNSKVDGLFSYQLYVSSRNTGGQWRVWGSAIEASVRGTNGGRIKYVVGDIQPTKSWIEAVSWTPKAKQTYSSGTTTLMLSPTVSGFSAGSFSRSWERTQGKTGGYMTSTERYDAVWEGVPTADARGIDALQSWKAPVGEGVHLRLHAVVKYLT